jgi:hypothetical protein
MPFKKDLASAVAMIFPWLEIATEWFRPEVSIARLKSVMVLGDSCVEKFLFLRLRPEILRGIAAQVIETVQRKYQ